LTLLLKQRVPRVAAAVLGVVASVLGRSAASAETYTDPLGLGLVVVGTDGSDARSSIVAVSQGGCADGLVAVAIGESSHDCWWNGFGHEAYGLVGLGLLGAEGGIAIGGGDSAAGLTALAVGGGNASGLVAVSDTGTAQAYCLGPIPWGDNCAEPGIAVSGTGTAYGDGHTFSGAGNAESTWDGTDNPLWPIVAVSALGGASGGNVAASGTGTARGRSTTTWQHPVPYPGVSVSGTGTASGGAVAFGGSNAQASGANSVAVSGGSANSDGFLCASATGSCYGGARVGIAPMGSSS
jgi:hypothetical protein